MNIMKRSIAYAIRTGGAAVVTVEATGVVPEGRITLWDSGLWKDEQIAVHLCIHITCMNNCVSL